MKDKILEILEKHSTPFLEGKAVHWSNWDKVADEILTEVIGIEAKTAPKQVEKDYLEMFNRIKKSFCEKRNMKFTPTRVVSKPSQLHARLKDYTIDELGKVIYNAFNDQYHIETKWKHLSTEFLTRADKVEKYFL